jgi:hypothetical protein
VIGLLNYTGRRTLHEHSKQSIEQASPVIKFHIDGKSKEKNKEQQSSQNIINYIFILKSLFNIVHD